MPADIVWKQGDTAPVYKETFTKSNGGKYNIEGAAIALNMRSLTSSTPVTLTGATAVLNAVEGEVSFTPSFQDTGVPGDYMATWTVVFPGGSQLTFPTDGYLWITVEENLTHSGLQQLISLPEVKEVFGIPPNDRVHDSQLVGLIEDVRPLIEEHTGPLLPQLFVERFDGGQNIISLTHTPSFGYGTTPILNLLGVSEFRGPIEYPLQIIQNPVYGGIYTCELDPRLGTITRRTAGGGVIAFLPGRNSVKVEYQAGQETIPANVRRACRETIRWWYQTTQAVGRGSLTQADSEPQMPMVSLPYHAVAMLNPTRRYPSLA